MNILSSRAFALALVGTGLGLMTAATGGTGCGSDAVSNPDYGSPPDAGDDFDPGPGTSGGGSTYGSGQPNGGGGGGGTTGGMDAGPVMPTCADSQKQCAEQFSFANTGGASSGITAVEVRGDYATGAWNMGTAMTLDTATNIWTASVQVPFGAPVQYKFYVTGTQYCQNQGQGNGPCWIASSAQPTVTLNGNTNNIANPVTCDSYTCAAGTCGEQPPPADANVYDWRDSILYFVFVDRFFNGNTSNDHTTPSAEAPAQYKGGDWAGVSQKITSGYFTDLGVNTLWITVPMANADNFAGEGVNDTHLYSAYHGYWSTFAASDSSHNPTIETAFGSLSDLQSMVTTAHAKGIKILFDFQMVSVQTDSPVYKNNPSWFWPNDDGQGGGTGSCVCGFGKCQYDTNYAGGTYSGLPVDQHCWFASYLAHWNYTNADARNYSVGLAIDLATSTKADGFRLDAVKHIDPTWYKQIRTEVQSQIVAPEMPQQRFYMVGETFDYSNRDFIKTFVDPDTALDGQFDFPERGQIAQSVLMRTQGMDALEAFMSTNDGYYCTGSANPAIMSTFVGNHDMPRAIEFSTDTPVFSDFGGNGHNWDSAGSMLQAPTSDTAAYDRLANGFAIILTNQGMPLIYYGDEIGLPGGGDPDNRRMMQFNDTATGMWTAPEQALHDRVKLLTSIRSAHPALRRGHRTTLQVDADIWAYSMAATTGTTTETLYIAVNRSDNAKTFSALPSGSYTELIAGDASGNVPARQTRIYIAK